MHLWFDMPQRNSFQCDVHSQAGESRSQHRPTKALLSYSCPALQRAQEGDWNVADGMTRAEFHQFYAKVFTTAGAITAKSAANE